MFGLFLAYLPCSDSLSSPVWHSHFFYPNFTEFINEHLVWNYLLSLRFWLCSNPLRKQSSEKIPKKQKKNNHILIYKWIKIWKKNDQKSPTLKPILTQIGDYRIGLVFLLTCLASQITFIAWHSYFILPHIYRIYQWTFGFFSCFFIGLTFVLTCCKVAVHLTFKF